MPVLKDFECQACGYVVECFVDGAMTEDWLWCESCGRSSKFQSICNGGTKTRYRFCDFSFTYDNVGPGKDVEYLRVGCHTEDEHGNRSPVTHYASKDVIDQRKKFVDQDRRSERRDRATFSHKKTRGKTPIRIDQKRATSAQGSK